MKNRIQQLMQVQHMNQQAFSNLTGISTATLSNILNGKTNPTMGQVSALMKTFPTLDSRWLLFGEGEMFVSDRVNSQDPDANNNSSQGTIAQHGATDKMAERSNATNQPADLFSVGHNSINTNPQQSANSSQHSPSSVSSRQQYGHAHQQYGSPQYPQMQINAASRRITEIRVYYDDQTWESFTPKK